MPKESTTKPLLRIGVISDSQSYPSRNDWGIVNMCHALKYFCDCNADVIVHAGDLAEYGDDKRPQKLYRQLLHEYFPSRLPVQVTCAGNHDLWVHGKTILSQRQLFEEYCEAMEEPIENPCVKTVNGITFIAVTEFNPPTEALPADVLKRLEEALENVTKSNPDKPVFVITHRNPQGTVAGAALPGHGIPEFREIFNRYPQIISLSAHTHPTLYDERCIWQGEFTAINTATMSYGCSEELPVNAVNSIVPFSNEIVEFMMMYLYEDRLEIHRRSVTFNCEIKPENRWQIPLPYNPASPTYSFSQRSNRNAPAFPPDAQIVLWYDYGFVYFAIEAASHEDFTHFYDMAITDTATGERKVYRYISDFHRPPAQRSRRPVFKFSEGALVPGKAYHLELTPVETFGNAGKPLELDTVIPATYHFRSFAPYPQE
ncbi:MAG: metallophosphoesterase [Victivallales bacterium]|nr:metallophosphoesterase [Victivallales bacterium]